MSSRLRLLLGAAALPLVVFALPPLSAGGKPNLSSRIQHKKTQIDWHKGRERVLASDVAGYTRRINGLQTDITRLQTPQGRPPGGPGPKRAELARIQEALRRERLRLARLRARL